MDTWGTPEIATNCFDLPSLYFAVLVPFDKQVENNFNSPSLNTNEFSFCNNMLLFISPNALLQSVYTASTCSRPPDDETIW